LDGIPETEEPDHIEDAEPETGSSHVTRFSRSFRVGRSPHTDRYASPRDLRTTHPPRRPWWLASGGANNPQRETLEVQDPV